MLWQNQVTNLAKPRDRLQQKMQNRATSYRQATPDLVRKRQRVGQGEAMANAVPLAGGALSGTPCKASHRAGVLLPA
jgi:hypothetical protein